MQLQTATILTNAICLRLCVLCQKVCEIEIISFLDLLIMYCTAFDGNYNKESISAILKFNASMFQMTYSDFLSLQEVLKLIQLVGQRGAGGLDEVPLGVVVGSFDDQLSVLVQPEQQFGQLIFDTLPFQKFRQSYELI